MRLVAEKEVVLRDRIKQELHLPSLRHFHGRVSTSKDLPDIDLAIIDDPNRILFIIELKWFVEPAEIREVLEKAQEIKKGISQLLALSKALQDRPEIFHKELSIDATYRVVFVVVSNNAIGQDWSQHPNVPVIQADHLLRKANFFNDLHKTADWLMRGEYLPVEGKDYEVMHVTSTIGKWNVRWYEIKVLILDEFNR
jgi:hypothetical protein